VDPTGRGAAGVGPVEAMNDADRRPSPDGKFTIEIAAWEARMSHWIETPRLVDASGGVVFAFVSSSWSLDSATWTSANVVQLLLRKYPGNHTPVDITCEIDCLARTATIAGTAVPIAELERRLDALLQWR